MAHADPTTIAYPLVDVLRSFVFGSNENNHTANPYERTYPSTFLLEWANDGMTWLVVLRAHKEGV